LPQFLATNAYPDGERMRAMVLRGIGGPLVLEDRPDPEAAAGQVRIRVEACAVCRTDLHLMDGELPNIHCPVIPGHEVVGRVEAIGEGVEHLRQGQRVGVPWLGKTCGLCEYCTSGRENLCNAPEFTGYSRDGGFATHVIAEAAFSIPLDEFADPVAAAPLLCAGLIGWRSLGVAGNARTIGLFGFGAAAHVIAQICRWQGRTVFAFTREGDAAAQAFARSLGAAWAGASDEPAPVPLDAAIIFAPVGDLIPTALRSVKKGGRVVCGGIHMSDIPSFPYGILWEERQLVSVANLTRADAASFLPIARDAHVHTSTRVYALDRANEALDDLRHGRLQGAAVLLPG
jgi:propanol-preferring alcohol dehydrogenase